MPVITVIMRVKAAGTGIQYFGWRFRKLAGSAWLGLSKWRRKQAHYADVIVPLSPATESSGS